MTGKALDNIIWTVVDGEAMLLDINSGHYYSLNPMGTEVWTSLHQGKSEAQIAEEIASTYRVEQAVVESDVAELIGELRSAGLLT